MEVTLRVLVMSNGERFFLECPVFGGTVTLSKDKKLLSGSPKGEHSKLSLLSIFPKMLRQLVVLEI